MNYFEKKKHSEWQYAKIKQKELFNRLLSILPIYLKYQILYVEWVI